jgi:SHS2 domain-containing protein
MRWRVVDDKNIADLYLQVFGKTKSELLQNILQAFTSQITKIDLLQPKKEVEITIKEKKFEQQLFLLIEKLIYLKDTKAMLFAKGDFQLFDDKIKVKLFGQKITKKLPLKTDIKSLTHHKFAVIKEKNQYVAHLVFDL